MAQEENQFFMPPEAGASAGEDKLTKVPKDVAAEAPGIEKIAFVGSVSFDSHTGPAASSNDVAEGFDSAGPGQSKPRLHYFPFAGRGELTRLIAAAGKLQIDDSPKQLAGKMSFGSPGALPCFEHGDFKIAQSFAIESYVAGIAPVFKDLTPAQRAIDGMLCKIKEGMMQGYVDILTAIVKNEVDKATAVDSITKVGDKWFPILIQKLSKIGFINGLAFPTAADLAVLNIGKGFMPFGAVYQLSGYNPFVMFPKFAAHVQRVGRYPSVKAYLGESTTMDADPLSLRSLVLEPPPQRTVQPDERDAKLTLATVDALAAVMDGHLRAGQIPEAVGLLRQALTAYDEDTQTHGESPPSMIACSALRLLLCTALSQGGCHDLAYQEAQSAASKMDEVWGEHLLGIDMGGGDRAVALRNVLRTPPSWLVRGVELAVQARQCAATELEFMKDWDLEVDGSDGIESDEKSTKLYRCLWEQIAQLHTEAAQLASQLLDKGHPVRASTERALQLWLGRGSEEDEQAQKAPPALPQRMQLPARVQTPVLAGMLAGRSGPADAAVKAGGGNRAWKTLAPAHFSLPALRGKTQMTTYERLHQGLDRPWEGPTVRKRTPLDVAFDNSCTVGSPSSASTSSNAQPPLKESRSDNQLHGAARRQIEASPNCASRRCPIFFNTNLGGRASWALRGQEKPKPKRTRAGGKEVVNPFEEFIKYAAGPQKSLAMQVTDDDAYMKKLHKGYCEKSRLFKNFWMKDEVDQDMLFEDRVRYTDQGIRTFNRSMKKYPKADFSKNVAESQSNRPPLAALFAHYGVEKQKKEVEPGIKSLGALLHKSNETFRKVQAADKKKAQGFDAAEEAKKQAAEAAAATQVLSLGGLFAKAPKVQEKSGENQLTDFGQACLSAANVDH